MAFVVWQLYRNLSSFPLTFLQLDKSFWSVEIAGEIPYFREWREPRGVQCLVIYLSPLISFRNIVLSVHLAITR